MWLPISQLWRFPPGSGAAIISAARLARMRASPLPRILRHATDAPLRRPVKWIPQSEEMVRCKIAPACCRDESHCEVP